MRNYRLTSSPRALRRSAVQLDNLALVPASMLPFKAQWQAIANDLLQGEILIVLPSQMKQQRVLLSVAVQMREKGHRVQVLDANAQRTTW